MSQYVRYPKIVTSGGGGTPANPANSVQYNNAGAFGGSSTFLFNGSNLITLGVEAGLGTFTAPDATTAGLAGGSLQLQAGDGAASGGGIGGSLTLKAGDALSGNENGGNFYWTPGAKSGSGIDGQVYIEDPTSGNSAILNTSLLSADQEFTFQDESGTLAIGQYGLNHPTTGSTYEYSQIPPSLTGQNNTALGVSAGNSMTSSARNVTIGTNAGTALSGAISNDNVIIGYNSLSSATTVVANNTVIGSNIGASLPANTVGSILVGYNILSSATLASQSNAMFGVNLLLSATGASSSVILGSDNGANYTGYASGITCVGNR